MPFFPVWELMEIIRMRTDIDGVDKKYMVEIEARTLWRSTRFRPGVDWALSSLNAVLKRSRDTKWLTRNYNVILKVVLAYSYIIIY